MDEPTFPTIVNVFKEIGKGIGNASHFVTKYSISPINALVVKEAQVKINFEMSRHGAQDNQDLGLNVLGLKTLSFSSATASQEWAQSNRAEVTLTIVSVVPPVDPDAPTTAKGGMNFLPIETLGVLPASLGGMQKLVESIKSNLENADMADGTKDGMRKDLGRIESRIKAKEILEARESLVDFTRKYVK